MKYDVRLSLGTVIDDYITEEVINYAIWLKAHAKMGYTDAYVYKGKMYYTDSHTDMIELYTHYLND
jgi:hypothetical protein